MKTVSHKFTKSSNKNSESDTTASQNSKVLPLKKSTPPGKQAKRDKISKEEWKRKAKQRTSEIAANKKRMIEIQESRNFHSTQNKNLSKNIECFKQKLADEVLRGDIEREKRLSIEGELEKVKKELTEINNRIDLFSCLQTDLKSKMENIISKILNYNFEKSRNPYSELTKETLKNIQIDFEKLQEELSSSETQLNLQLEENEKQLNQNKTFLGSLSNLCQQTLGYASKRLQQLKEGHNNLKKRLKTSREMFENKKNRQGDFNTHERPKNYSYSASIIKMSLLYLISAALSIRAIAKSLEINSFFLDTPTPSHTIINEWANKVGFYIYNSPKDKNIERIWIVDFSIQFGQDKLMLVLGIDIKKMLKNKTNKGKFKIGFHDIEVLHMVVVKSTAYKITLQELEKIAEKCGLPLFVVSDEGSDLAKGIRIFIENNQGIKHLHDISHKLSNILKAELENNKKWIEFTQVVNLIKQKIKLSNIAQICPPKFRQKVRFLNVRDPLNWAAEMLQIDMDLKFFDQEQKENFIKYIKEPLEPFKKEIMQWHEYTIFITEVETEIKYNGLTRGDESKVESTSKILNKFLNDQIRPKNLKWYNQIIKFIKEQEAKLSPGQTIICSSDIVESMFGKWKFMSHEDSMAGITDMILKLPLITAKLTDELVLEALENTPVQKINDWKAKTFGKTMYAKRRAILLPKTKKKRTRNRGNLSVRDLKKIA